MAWLACGYFGADVELTDERLRHIRRKHSDIRPDALAWIARTLAQPDAVHQRLWALDEYLLTLSLRTAGERRMVVVVVEDEPASDTGFVRRWVVTAYTAGEDEVSGEVIWRRDES